MLCALLSRVPQWFTEVGSTATYRSVQRKIEAFHGMGHAAG